MDGLNKEIELEKLEFIRQEIDEIDRQMLALFESRMNKILQVAEYKAAHNLKILDVSREQVVLQKADLLENREIREYAVYFLKNLMELSKKLQAEKLRQLAAPNLE